MTKTLVIEEITPQGPKEIGQVSGGEVIVGRDPGDGLTVENTAISRSHGVFMRMRNHWFYKDLGSTNGSWVNSKQVKEGQMRLVRPGDLLQLADTPLRISVLPEVNQPQGVFPPIPNSTLIVFSGTMFQDEFPLPEYGRALVVGGNQADLPLGEGQNDVPRLVIERRGDKVCAYGISEGPPIIINGAEINETVFLADGDEVKVANYTILFNDPRASVAQLTPQAEVATPRQSYGNLREESSTVAGQPFKDWGEGGGSLHNVGATAEDDAPRKDDRSASGRYTFGRPSSAAEDDIEGTIAIDQSEVEARLAGYDKHPASRYGAGQRPAGGGGALHSVEDKVILLVGFTLLLALLIVVVWWFFL